jgi:putative acetyltransferase
LATLDGASAGCMVFRDLGDGIVEFRRMWVRPPFRRRGVARRILAAAEAEARSLGYRRVQFMTSPRLEGALDLYRSQGYEQMDLYREVQSDSVVALGRDL